MKPIAHATALFMFATILTPAWASEGSEPSERHVGPHYTYLEAGASRIAHDGIDAVNGLTLRGSWQFADDWHVYGGVKHYGFDEFDATGARIGIGLAAPVSERADLVLRAGYETLRIDLDPHAHGHALEEASAASLEVGVRAVLSERLEVQVGLRHAFFDGAETLLLAGAEYRFNEDWALSADIDYADSGKEWFLGARRYF